jgi:hypothetical protein
MVALTLRWLCRNCEGEKDAGGFKPLWGDQLETLVCSLFDRIKTDQCPIPSSNLLDFVHKFLVLQFTQRDIPMGTIVGSICEQMVVLYMIHPSHGWKSAAFLVRNILCPFKNIARAVLLQGAFLNSFEKGYKPNSAAEVPLAWNVDESNAGCEDDDESDEDGVESDGGDDESDGGDDESDGGDDESDTGDGDSNNAASEDDNQDEPCNTGGDPVSRYMGKLCLDFLDQAENAEGENIQAVA